MENTTPAKTPETTEIKEVVELTQKALPISKTGIAELLGYTQNYFSNVMSGKKPATNDFMSAVKRLKRKVEAFSTAG